MNLHEIKKNLKECNLTLENMILTLVEKMLII